MATSNSMMKSQKSNKYRQVLFNFVTHLETVYRNKKAGKRANSRNSTVDAHEYLRRTGKPMLGADMETRNAKKEMLKNLKILWDVKKRNVSKEELNIILHDLVRARNLASKYRKEYSRKLTPNLKSEADKYIKQYNSLYNEVLSKLKTN